MTILQPSTFVEVDPGNDISIADPRCSLTNINNYNEAYVYKDMGADYWDAVEARFCIQIDSQSGGADHKVAVFGLANQANDIRDITGYAWYILFFYDNSAAQFSIRLQLYNNGALVGGDYTAAISASTPYYCKFVRASGSTVAYLYIYTDSNFSTLWDTLTYSAAGGSTKFQYVYYVSTDHSGSNIYFTGFSEKIEVPPYTGGSRSFGFII